MDVWTEKYRPKTLGDVRGHGKIIERLKDLVEQESVPHMLFAGPAGTGKTTTALCIAQDLFGEGWKNNYLELNASDTRGIDVIRNEVKDFARTRSVADAPFKVICLDEADSLTSEAQQALRRTMENYTDTTRFILSCNYSSRIIDPIQSRCAVFRFSRLDDEEARGALEKIAENEGLDVAEDGLDAILYITGGDMRRAINLLQASALSGEEIDEDSVYSIAAQARPEEVREMMEAAVGGSFGEARERLYSLLIDRGIAGEDIVKEIHRTIYQLDRDEKAKLRMIEELGDYEFRLDSGGDPMIQLEAYLAQLGAE